LEASKEIFAALQKLNVRACLIGGLAVQRWGQPRQTVDVDLTMAVELESEEHIVDELLRQFEPRISDAKAFALSHRVLLLKASNGVGLDLALGLTSFEAKSVERSTLYLFAPGFAFPTCSAEDLLIHKCFAGRHRDLADAEQIVARNLRALDMAYVRYWLSQLAQALDDSSLLQRLETVVKDATGKEF
jgi:hypothetical protein